MYKNLGRKLTEYRLHGIAFIVPIVCLAVAFAVNGVYPAGDRQIAVIDMFHQYVPFLSELQYKLQNGGSLFYSWNGAAGHNFWCLLSYYCASPLNLLLVLVPSKFIMEAVTGLVMIKLGLAGLFMFIFLENLKDEKMPAKGANIVTVAFADLYALCAFAMAYYWDVMWLDGMALLPLCILGLLRLINEGKAVLYTVSLALIVFSNYYIAIMICYFICIYYLMAYFMVDRGLKGKPAVRHFFVTTGKVAGHSLIGVAMAGVLLIPTIISMRNAYALDNKFPENWSLYNNPLDIINQLLPAADLTYREGLPNIYCGLLVVICLAFYYLSRTISLREKVIHGVFFIVMFLSLNVNVLDWVWHGFHFPIQLPYRFSFVISFVLVGMTYRAYLRIYEIKTNVLWKVFAVGLGYYLIASKLMEDVVDDIDVFFYFGVGLFILYIAAMVLRARNKLSFELFNVALALIVAVELCVGCCIDVQKVGTTDRNHYFANSESIETLTKQVEPEMARVEVLNGINLNTPQLYNYKGVSQFSSTLNANQSEFMEAIGVEGRAQSNSFFYIQNNPVTNAILNLKYVINRDSEYDDPNFEEIAKEGNSRLYESKYPLGIGYVVGTGINTWNPTSANPFENLDEYVRAVSNNKHSEVFQDTGDPTWQTKEAVVKKTAHGKFDVQLSGTSANEVTLTYTVKKSGNQYVYVEADNADSIEVIGNKQNESIEVNSSYGGIVYACTAEEGEEFQVKIVYEAADQGNITAYAKTLNEKVWADTYEMISENLLDVTEYGDTYIKGNISLSEDGVMATSIPWEKGWKLIVDGEEKDINQLIGGAFIGVPLSSGSHEIYLKFTPPGLWPGLACSIAAILALVAIEIVKRRKTVKEKEAQLIPAAPETESAAPDRNQLFNDSDDLR